MYIKFWILVVVGFSFFMLFCACMNFSASRKRLMSESFKRYAIKSVKFNMDIIFFSPSGNTVIFPIATNQIELLLETSHYQNKEVFELESFKKIAADLGFLHIVFVPFVRSS